MSKSRFVFDKFAKLIEQGLINYKDVSDEVISILKSKRDEIVFKMKLASKEEVDVLNKRISILEKKLEQKFKDLEAEINNKTSPVRPFNPKEVKNNETVSRVTNWFQGLETPAKVGVAVVGVIVGLSVLNGVLKLVTSLIVVGILGFVLYGLYRALIQNKSK